MLASLCQSCILFLSGLSGWGLATKRYKLGFASALIAEPLWMYSNIQAEQWGMLIAAFVYTLFQIGGLKNHW